MELLKTSFAKLNADNYNLWKFKLELILRKEGIWNCVTQEELENPDATWKKQDSDATVIIGLSVEDSQLLLIRKAKSAHEAWETLRSQHEKNTLGSSVKLMRKICSMKYTLDKKMEEHILDMKILFEKLEALGENFAERWLVAMLLSSLPSSFDTLVTALEARKLEELNLKIVEASLMDEYQRQAGSTDSNSVLKTQDNRTVKRCHFCNKKGHLKRDCWKMKRIQNEKKNTTSNETNVNFCFLTPNGESYWIVDSGATCHICNNEADFTSIDRKVTEEARVANGQTIVSSGKGKCLMKTINSKQEAKQVIINDVLFILSFQGNLLSVPKLLQKGFMVTFQDRICKIFNNQNSEVAAANLRNGLFQISKSYHEKAMIAEC